LATEILISSDPWENRVAIFEDGALAEIYFEREEKVVGSIYKGKVQNVLQAMNASFVDIGLGRNAFLYVDDINKTPLNIGDVEVTQGRSGWTITEKVTRGDEVLVQIIKEPRGLKGARVSTNISLPGRYLILMPTGKYSGVSRKVESAAERTRLKTIMKLIRPEGMATVVRTAAAGVSQAELIADLGVLIRMWHGILETYKRAAAPALIHKDMNLVYKAARDFITPEVERVLIDNSEEYEKVRDFMRLLGPQYVDRIAHYDHGRSLFKDRKIDEELQRLLKPKINLPSGGSIVIETTEALTVIDVNSGKTSGKNLEDTILRTNVEAAAEIARQVRLRDIGGIIVCDFIDMGSETARNKVIAMLENGLRKDRTRTTIQSFSALGLLEFTRKRVGKDLSGQLRGACPTCSGLGTVMSPETVAIETFRELRNFGHTHTHTNGRAGNGKEGGRTAIQVHAAPTVGAQLEYWYEDEMTNLEKEIGARVNVVVDATLHPEKTKMELAAENPAKPASEPIRVGDEVEVDLLHARLPNPLSALAVVGNRLVEVENAANAVGQSVRIRIIDVDEDGNILAEPRAPVAPQAAADGRRRRRRGGRGRRKPLTVAEQTEELRELAEEAARGLGGRTVAIGISTAADAEQEAAATPQAAAAPIVVVPPTSVTSSYFGEAATPNGEGGDVRRRRRRRRRRRGAETPIALAGIPAQSAAVQTSETDVAEESGPTVARVTAPQPAVQDEDGTRRRRRRRRRRGRGGAVEGGEGFAASSTVPERHIFEVDARGGASGTGKVAPPEPTRAVARRPERPGAVALEAPPRSLRVSEAPPKTTRVARKRVAQAAAPRPIESKAVAALPAGSSADVPKRGRARKAAGAQAPPADVPKPRTRRVAATAAAPVRPKPAAKAVPAKPKPATKAASAKVTTKASAAVKAASKTTKPAPVKAAASKPKRAAATKKTPARKTSTTAKKAAGKKGS
jgi:ribonuclease G